MEIQIHEMRISVAVMIERGCVGFPIRIEKLGIAAMFNSASGLDVLEVEDVRIHFSGRVEEIRDLTFRAAIRLCRYAVQRRISDGDSEAPLLRDPDPDESVRHVFRIGAVRLSDVVVQFPGHLGHYLSGRQVQCDTGGAAGSFQRGFFDPWDVEECICALHVSPAVDDVQRADIRDGCVERRRAVDGAGAIRLVALPRFHAQQRRERRKTGHVRRGTGFAEYGHAAAD